MKSRFLRHALAIVPALFLVACGGGGGGDEGSSGGASTAVQLAITTTNSQAVAAEGLEASTNYEAAAAGGSLVTGVQVDAGTGSNPVLLANAVRTLLADAPQGSALATGVTTTQNYPCNTGSMTVTSDIAGTTGALTAGDSFTFTASSCTQGVGADAMVMNGTMTVRILSVTFDPDGPDQLSMKMHIVARVFRVSFGGETTVANGDITMSLTERGLDDVSVSISSTSMASNIGTHTVTLKGYTHSVTETAAGTTIQMTATIETSNARLGGSLVSYQVSTPTAIVVNSAGQVTAGVLKVTGSGGSSLLLTVTGTDTFSLQVDADGNGTYESTSTVTRLALNGLI